jgi:hypothetical protein
MNTKESKGHEKEQRHEEKRRTRRHEEEQEEEQLDTKGTKDTKRA